MRNISAGLLSLYLTIFSQLPARADLDVSPSSAQSLDPVTMTISGVALTGIFIVLGFFLKKRFDSGSD